MIGILRKHRMRRGSDTKPPRVWVVFSGQADVPWLRLLKPGFRHCYIVMRDNGQWISVDPMLHQMEVHVHADLPPDFDMPGWLEARGQRVVMAFIDGSHKRPAPWRPFTCVEAVKRILGLHARFILTPWQLYRYLTQPEQEKELYHGKSHLAPQSTARSAA